MGRCLPIAAVQLRWRADPDAAGNAIYDVNGDGRIDVLDVQRITSMWGTGQ